MFKVDIIFCNFSWTCCQLVSSFKDRNKFSRNEFIHLENCLKRLTDNGNELRNPWRVFVTDCWRDFVFFLLFFSSWIIPFECFYTIFFPWFQIKTKKSSSINFANMTHFTQPNVRRIFRNTKLLFPILFEIIISVQIYSV